jgi:hypothetical protein
MSEIDDVLRDDPPGVGISARLRELQKWIESTLTWVDVFHNSSLKSTRRDYSAKFTTVGRNLRKSIPELTLINGFPRQVIVGSAAATVAYDPLRAAVTAALAKLRKPAALVASYNDLYVRCLDGNATAASILDLQRLFKELAELNGHNFKYLVDDLLELPMDARLALLSRPVDSDHHEIWFGYDQAKISAKVTIDNVTFYPPDTLTDLHWAQNPSEEWVAVKVELEGVFPDAVKSARDAADVLLTIARNRSFESHWIPLDGYRHINSKRRITSALGPKPRPWIPNDIGDALLKMSSINHKAVASDLIEAVHSLADSGSQLGATSVILDVRLIESMAVRCGLHWTEHIAQNLTVGATVRLLRRQLFNGIYYPAANEGFGEIAEKVGEPNGIYMNQNFEQALAAVEPLLKSLEPGWLKHTVRDVKWNFGKMDAFRKWYQHLLDLHHANTLTLVRCRNNLVHGGPIEPEVVRAIAWFAHQQASETVTIALEGNLRGISIGQAHQDHTADWFKRAAKFDTASDVRNALLL